jgi:hypothetical protein
MRDFSYKMQQIKDFSCKNQGRGPGRPQKDNAKKECQLNFAPKPISELLQKSLSIGPCERLNKAS